MAALPSDDVEATLDVSNNADGVNEPCGNGTRKCRNRSSKRDNNATICWKFQVPMKHVTYVQGNDMVKRSSVRLGGEQVTRPTLHMQPNETRIICLFPRLAHAETSQDYALRGKRFVIKKSAYQEIFSLSRIWTVS